MGPLSFAPPGHSPYRSELSTNLRPLVTLILKIRQIFIMLTLRGSRLVTACRKLDELDELDKFDGINELDELDKPVKHP